MTYVTHDHLPYLYGSRPLPYKSVMPYRFVTDKYALRKILRVPQDVINVRIANKTFHSLSIIEHSWNYS